jgi:A/G-specific adenine glycosylase
MTRLEETPIAHASTEDIQWLRRRIRAWSARNARDFPWRETRDPYEVLLAELLLQRTRADLVPPVLDALLRRYPSPGRLAAASPDDVVELMRPLGFTHRSARLPHIGRELCARFEGEVPRTDDELMSLPGVGRYVASAVLVMAFGLSRPLLDPNVYRLLQRCLGVTSDRTRPRDDDRLWSLVAAITPARDPRPVALGMIDLGAVVCRPRRPRCVVCPLRPRCRAFRDDLVRPAN